MGRSSTSPLSAAQRARVGTSLALWTVLPIVVGWWRVAHSDVLTAPDRQSRVMVTVGPLRWQLYFTLAARVSMLTAVVGAV